MNTSIITSPEELRRVLLESMVGVLEGRVSVPQANAMVGISSELHKSIRQQWDMQVYAAENLMLSNGELITLEDLSGVE